MIEQCSTFSVNNQCNECNESFISQIYLRCCVKWNITFVDHQFQNAFDFTLFFIKLLQSHFDGNATLYGHYRRKMHRVTQKPLGNKSEKANLSLQPTMWNKYHFNRTDNNYKIEIIASISSLFVLWQFMFPINFNKIKSFRSDSNII